MGVGLVWGFRFIGCLGGAGLRLRGLGASGLEGFRGAYGGFEGLGGLRGVWGPSGPLNH